MSEMKPTPGIENMDKRAAQAHFQERLERIKKTIDGLPPDEMLMLAAELVQTGNLPKLAIATAKRAIEKLEAKYWLGAPR